MILEAIVTSLSGDGQPNIAPMGPRVDQLCYHDLTQSYFTLRPFESSRTYANLIATRRAVIHVTDDVELFAQAAVDALDDTATENLLTRLDDSDWRVLADCHCWFAVEVESIEGTGPRWDMACRVVRAEITRPFFGFNRAKHAVIEAAILATRTQLLEAESIREQLERLEPLVEKTAGPAEFRAFEFLRRTIRERLHAKERATHG